jgi:hypothetical protein
LHISSSNNITREKNWIAIWFLVKQIVLFLLQILQLQPGIAIATAPDLQQLSLTGTVWACASEIRDE